MKGLTAKPFILQIDASSFEIGVVLEQAGIIVAYAIRVLTKAEKPCGVI